MPKLRSLSERKNAGNTKSRLEDFKKLNCVSFQNVQIGAGESLNIDMRSMAKFPIAT